MTTYAIHSPQLTGDWRAVADDLRVERVGFSGLAFWFAPLWLIAKRLWLPLLIYGAAAVLVAALVAIEALPIAAAVALYFVAGVLTGCEGPSWFQSKLARRGRPMLDLIEAINRDDAIRVFLARRGAAPSASAAPRSARTDTGIIGLFPEARG